MASYTVAAGDIAVHEKTLVASTVDTVTFTDDCNRIEIISDGAAELFVRLDGSAPVVDGTKAYRLPAGSTTVREVDIPSSWASNAGGVVVKLISAGTPKYSVTKVG